MGIHAVNGKFQQNYYCRACEVMAVDEPVCFFCGEPSEKRATGPYVTTPGQSPNYTPPPPH